MSSAVIVLASTWLAASAVAPNESLRRTLARMGQEDQAEIQQSYQDEHAPNHARQRQVLLKQILAEFGWPGVSLAGQDGAAGAWTVAQHADDDVAFQRMCLAHLERAYQKGDVPGLHLAYLTDRVLVNERKPQVYGTQGAPIYDDAERARVNARRKRLGLPSMAEMARQRGHFYEQAYRQAAGSPGGRGAK